jgi:hypothetical protein
LPKIQNPLQDWDWDTIDQAINEADISTTEDYSANSNDGIEARELFPVDNDNEILAPYPFPSY